MSIYFIKIQALVGSGLRIYGIEIN